MSNHQSTVSGEDLYPSRNGGTEQIIQRKDPIVYGDTQPDVVHTLNTSQLNTYYENGYVVLPDYMPQMVVPLQDEVNRLKASMVNNEELVTEPDSPGIRSIFRPNVFSQLIDRFSRNPKILNIARQLLGSDVYITQARVNVKPAFNGQSFAWHSDFETWYVEDGMRSMRAVTAWIMLTENNEFNGPLYVIPGSHKNYISCAGITNKKNYTQSLKRQKVGVPRHETMRRILQDLEIQSIHGSPGSMVFHDCNLLHASPDNISGVPCTVLMLVFNSCENAFEEPFSYQSPRPRYLRNPDTTALDISHTCMQTGQ